MQPHFRGNLLYTDKYVSVFAEALVRQIEVLFVKQAFSMRVMVG